MGFKKILINFLKFFGLSDLIEVWVKVKKPYDGYKISNYGRVKNKKGNLINPIICKWGYLRVRYSYKGKSRAFSLNREVMIAFDKDRNLEVNHNDRIKFNNRYSNLEYLTPSQNQKHRREDNKIKERILKNMLIGETYTTKGGTVYTIVNKKGTFEKLGRFPWYIRLYLEIRNGILKPLSLEKLREYKNKYYKIYRQKQGYSD